MRFKAAVFGVDGALFSRGNRQAGAHVEKRLPHCARAAQSFSPPHTGRGLPRAPCEAAPEERCYTMTGSTRFAARSVLTGAPFDCTAAQPAACSRSCCGHEIREYTNRIIALLLDFLYRNEPHSAVPGAWPSPQSRERDVGPRLSRQLSLCGKFSPDCSRIAPEKAEKVRQNRADGGKRKTPKAAWLRGFSGFLWVVNAC